MSTPTRKLMPRDYATDPLVFGRLEALSWVLPEDGTEADLRIAQAQHDIAWTIYASGQRGLVAAITYRGRFSVKTWSDYSLGKSWMSRQAYAAAASEFARSIRAES
ncbi:hypothetical protein GCM10009798_34690 [Nocardioides panacihumi]|uniref:Uncharacterized protein n=1 Tax=Nocardioides panacihumi TaxID=400774 RepID=A0ABP5CYB2_9ACTN